MLEDGLRYVNLMATEQDLENIVATEQDLEDIATKEQDLKDDKINIVGAKYLRLENSVSFIDSMIYTVELPVLEYKCPEVLEAKDREVRNHEDYNIFEEVVDDGQDTIVSQWVITQKDKQDGQKIEHKVRLVARGF